jgi:hypothetical protein
LRQLRESLGLDAANWAAFQEHARAGFADFERRHWFTATTTLRLEDVPAEWLGNPEALGHVVLRVLKSGNDRLAVPVAEFFLRICDPGDNILLRPPGIGLAWLYLAQRGLNVPAEPARLVHLALCMPAAFFQGVSEEELLALGRLMLEASGSPKAWDLHLLLAAVDQARLHARASFQLFDDLMAADWLPCEVKEEFCLGLLGCSPQQERLRERAGAARRLLPPDTERLTLLPGVLLQVASQGLGVLAPGMQRHAVRALVEALGWTVQAVAQEFFLRAGAEQRYGDMIDLGVLDVVRSRPAELESADLRKLLERAIGDGSVSVRKAAYRIGLEQFGREFVRPGLKDSAQAVRKWASRALEEGAVKPGRRRKRPGGSTGVE